MNLKIKFVILFILLISPTQISAQSLPGRGGTGNILVETWDNTNLYEEFDARPGANVMTWAKSLSIDGCFAHSIYTQGNCVPKDPNKDPNIYGPLKNNPFVGIDIIPYQGRNVARFWIKQDTGHSHGARLVLTNNIHSYNFLQPWANRRIYARYYMMFPQLLPVVQNGGSWTSIGVEMKDQCIDCSATVQQNYDREHNFWQKYIRGNMNYTPFKFQANKWYKMDVIWDMFPDNRGRWQTFVDGVKYGEATGQMAHNPNGYGHWIFNLYGDMFANQQRGEMYIGDFILSTQPITDSTPSPTPIDNGSYFKFNVSSVTASSHDGNVPQNTLDGNLNTRWSACGEGEWIKYDLGSTKNISYLNIAFYLAPTQITSFDIETSTNNSTWTKVFSGQSGTQTLGLQKFDFNDVSARYVRIVGYGNHNPDVACWNSLTEVEIYGGKPGDANNDNVVDGKDYVIWLNNYGDNTASGASKGDFNNDGKVDGQDYVVWVNNYNK